MKGTIYFRRFFSVAILLLFIQSCSNEEKVKVQNDVFDEIQPGYGLMAFLAEIEKKELSLVSDSLDSRLKENGYQKAKNLPLIIGSDTMAKPKGSLMWKNPRSEITLFIKELKNITESDSLWSEVSGHIGRYSGTTLGKGGIYYLKEDSENPTSLNATFKADNKIFQVHAPLNFLLTDVFELEDDQQKELFTANKEMIETMEILIDVFVSDKNQLYRPSNGRLLTENQRLVGLINFWTEVKYNFAFFDQVPDLDWQNVLMNYIPKVRNAKSNLEYYRILQEVCGLLNDGHTNVYFPSELQMLLGVPAISVTSLDESMYITNIDKDLLNNIPLGSQLISVEQVPVEQYIDEYIRPYISSSTEHIRKNIEAQEVLKGNKTDSVRLEIKTPEGKVIQLVMGRNPSNVEWAKPKDSWKLSTFKSYDEIAYVALNGFASSKIVEEFESYLDSIQIAKALIIDLRNNHGGNSGNGYDILQYICDEPIITSKWKTREHRPAFKAWGAFVDENFEHLGSWDRETLASFKDDYWFESGPDTIAPTTERNIILPTIVLMGNNTASAAEDFLVAADPIENIVTMGEYSYGSTGQPMFIRLPGGGKARICTKRDTYADGREFVGYGIQPDIQVPITLEDILSGEDPVLNKALKYLMEK